MTHLANFNDKFSGLLSNPAFMAGLGIMSSGGDLSGALGGLQTAEGYRQQFADRKKQQEAEALKKQYLSAFQSGLGENPDINSVAQSLMASGNPEWAMRGAGLASSMAPGQETWGVSPIWANVGGKKVPFQVSNRGQMQQLQLPEGAQGWQKAKTQDLADRVAVLDESGQQIGTMDKGLDAAAAETLRGKVGEQKRLDAPMKIMTVDSTMETIDEMLSIPGLEGFTGRGAELGGFLARAGTDRRDFQELKKSVIDQVLMIEFDKLRGTGPITEQEAERAQRAATALNENMSDARFVREVNRLKRRLGRLRAAYIQDLGGEQPAEAEAISDQDLLSKYGIN